MRRNVWLEQYKPGGKDRHIESAWLDEHYLYGGNVHLETAAAIKAALSKPTTRAAGHALYVKLFAEFANALEVAGAWGWVLRTRRQHPLFLDAFMTYDHNAPRSFYAAASRNRGSAIRLFDLPPEDKVIDALEAIFPRVPAEERRKALNLSVKQAKFLARRYRDHGELIPTILNRIKHGATLLHDESLSDREFWVLAPHRRLRDRNDTARYLLPKFRVDRDSILGTERDLTAAVAMTRFLAGLAKIVKRSWAALSAAPSRRCAAGATAARPACCGPLLTHTRLRKRVEVP